MTLAAEKQIERIGQTCGAADHDHDLVHELSKRLDALWRYDQYIANADGHPSIQAFWRDVKQQEMQNVQRLKDLVSKHVKQGCF